MKKYNILFAFIACFQFIHAQDSTMSYRPTTSIKFGIVNSMKSPGIKFGSEIPYKIIQVDINKKKGLKTIYKERSLTYNLGMYYHRNAHTNYFFLVELQFRRQKSRGMFYEFSPGIGGSKTFLDGATYEVDDHGNVKKIPLAGHSYAAISMSGGFGYNFAMKQNVPIRLYIKPSVLVLFPYNYSLYMRPMVDVGVIYSKKKIGKANPTFKKKTK